MYNGSSLALIEIKHKVHPSDLVKLSTTKVENFRMIFPKYKNHKIFLGIGGFSIPASIVENAKKRGIGVLKQKAETAVIESSNLIAY